MDETRVALIGIIVSDGEAAEKIKTVQDVVTYIDQHKEDEGK